MRASTCARFCGEKAADDASGQGVIESSRDGTADGKVRSATASRFKPKWTEE